MTGRKGATRKVRKRENGIAAWVRNEKLELQVKLGSNRSIEKCSAKFDVSKYMKFVPPDVDKYFLHFEKVAGNLKWLKEYWIILLQSVSR